MLVELGVNLGTSGCWLSLGWALHLTVCLCVLVSYLFVCYYCVCMCVCAALVFPDEQAARMLADKVQQLSNDQFEELRPQLRETSPSDNHKKVKLKRFAGRRRGKELVQFVRARNN